MIKRLHTRRSWLLVFAVLAIVFEAYYVGEYIINTPNALSEKAILLILVDQVTHPRDVQKVKRIAGNKTTSAFVTDLFSTTLSIESLVAFYTAEFMGQGYYIAETDMSNAHDLNGQRVVITFCKGNYTIWLRYKGLTHTIYPETDKWNFAIDFNWRSRGCEPG